MASKKLTLPQVRAIYNAGMHGYINSYAMMVDDILNGMKTVAAKYGKTPYCDVAWFQVMHGYIRTCRPWTMIPEEKQREIVDMVNQSKW